MGRGKRMNIDINVHAREGWKDLDDILELLEDYRVEMNSKVEELEKQIDDLTEERDNLQTENEELKEKIEELEDKER
jgi:peptidoglycan hydrolase CwlO-like protein